MEIFLLDPLIRGMMQFCQEPKSSVFNLKIV